MSDVQFFKKRFTGKEALRTIDLNCDLGEGCGLDAAVMPYISSCNIACGGHAGDLESMNTTVLLAKAHQVKIGAHPSFPDRENFGRKVITLSPSDLVESLIHQVCSLEQIAADYGLKLHHIKLHGALYHQAAHDPKTARLMVQSVSNDFGQCFLYAPYGSVLADMAVKEGLKIKHEVFADRNYNADLSLVSRGLPNAVLTDWKAALAHITSIVTEGKVKVISGEWVPLLADTICVHGDNPEAVALTAAIHDQLKQEGFLIR